MSNHKPVYFFEQGEMYAHWALCKTCGHRTPKALTLQLAEDQWMKHLAFVERVKSHLGTRTPSLKQQRDYYADMAANDEDPKQRPIWKQLADELSVRLGDKAPQWEQPELMDF